MSKPLLAGVPALLLASAALAQLSAEFAPRQRGWFDRLMDGLNRLPRPAS